MYLFEIQGDLVEPSVHALLIPELAALWTEDKFMAIKHFSYIEFSVSKKKSNPFAQVKSDEKDAKIKKKIYGDANYVIPINVEIALTEFNKMQHDASSAIRLLDAAVVGLEKTTTFLSTVDYSIETRSGMPKWKPKDVLDSIGKMDKALADISTLRDKVDQDLYETSKTVKDREINDFER